MPRVLSTGCEPSSSGYELSRKGLHTLGSMQSEVHTSLQTPLREREERTGELTGRKTVEGWGLGGPVRSEPGEGSRSGRKKPRPPTPGRGIRYVYGQPSLWMYDDPLPALVGVVGCPTSPTLRRAGGRRLLVTRCPQTRSQGSGGVDTGLVGLGRWAALGSE